MNPFVASLVVLPSHRLLLTFTDGQRRIFDATPYLRRGVFSALEDLRVFASARVIAGSVEWEQELDLSYDTLYLESVPITDAA